MVLLKYTKDRLENVIDLVSRLKNNDYPYDHPRQALGLVSSHLQQQLETLEKLDESYDLQLIKQACKEVNLSIIRIYPLLGFIERSTDNRNLFEFHGPFLKLVKKVLGDDSKLIISSDWKYSPYTYIFHSANILGKIFNNFVWISFPASESSKAQTIPLSGHEFGHNIWNKEKLGEKKYNLSVKNKIINTVEDIFDEYKKVFPNISDVSDITSLFGENTWRPAYQASIHQCQEVFCDLVGLLIFKESFLYAIEYFLSPGLPGLRSHRYLNTIDRIEVLLKASKEFGVNCDDGFVGHFDNSDFPSERQQSLTLSIADHATKSLVDDLINESKDIIDKYDLDEYSESGVDSVQKSFKNGVPIYNEESLSNILNGAWDFYNNGYPEWEIKYPEIYNDKSESEKMLSELVIKSIEITDILSLLDK